MRNATKRKLGQLWGYVLVAVVAYGWFGLDMAPGAIAALSVLVVLYTLFQAPMWCCATTRSNEPCRNNAYGLLLGCHLRQHRWQKFWMAMHASSWGQLARRALSGVGGVAASLSALAGTLSAVVALAALLFK